MSKNYRQCMGSKYGCGQKKAMNQKAYTGMDPRVFVNKDDPNYKPSFGRTYTARQLKIMNEELTLDEFTQGELTLLTRKAENFEDEEALAKIAVIQKLKNGEDNFAFSYSPDEAKDILQSLTPWAIDWDKQKTASPTNPKPIRKKSVGDKP